MLMSSVNNLPKIISNVKSKLKDAAKEIEITEVANIQANTPVDTGTLKKSIAGDIKNNKDNLIVTLGVDGSFVNPYNKTRVEEYAVKVEYENKSYIRDTLKGEEVNIKSIVNKHLSKVGG